MSTKQKQIVLNDNNNTLLACTFKCSPYIKHKLILEAKAQGITLSETVNNIVSFYDANEDIRKQFNEKMEIFIKQISGGDNDKIDRLVRIWNKIELK